MNTPKGRSLLYDTSVAEGDGGVGAFVRSWLPAPPARVLEIGCGDGELALALAEEGWRVTAVDPAAPEGEPFIRGAIEDLDPLRSGARPVPPQCAQRVDPGIPLVPGPCCEVRGS